MSSEKRDHWRGHEKRGRSNECKRRVSKSGEGHKLGQPEQGDERRATMRTSNQFQAAANVSQGACGASADGQPAARPKGGKPNALINTEQNWRGKGARPKTKAGNARESSNGKAHFPAYTTRTNEGQPKRNKMSEEYERPYSTPKNPPSKWKQQPDGRWKHKRLNPVLDHGVLKTLIDQDCSAVIESLNERIAGLKFLLRSKNEEHTGNEFIFDLVLVLAKACEAPSSENINTILIALKGSLFLNEKIPKLLDKLQGKNALVNGDSRTRLIQRLIKIFSRYLRHLPSSFTDIPIEQMQQVLHQMDGQKKGRLQEKLDLLKQERSEAVRAERERHGKRTKDRKGNKPPNDFREIPVCPTTKEVLSRDQPFLRKNIVKGRYEDREHYLDVQFRLLREDFLEPVREGIYEVAHNVPRNKCNQMMKRYSGVRIVRKEYTMAGIVHTVRFDVSRLGATRWSHSRRLIYGSFLCLSKDNFQSMLFATVANRHPDKLRNGELGVRFVEGQHLFGIEKDEHKYQMVESPAYFEAYRHVLGGLKELDENSLPFGKYLVECSPDVDTPKYLRREPNTNPVLYDLTNALGSTTKGIKSKDTFTAVNILQHDAWPSAKYSSLNMSQLEALKTAITTEFCVIQGPPGTGKTYVGAKIVQCLLDNRSQWDPEQTSPMLMVCYTNHALDQFLEKVLDFLPSDEIIRVGGRCKSERLENCNVKRFVSRFRMDEKNIEETIRENEVQMRKSQEQLQKSLHTILRYEVLDDFINHSHLEQLHNAKFPHNADQESRKVQNTFKLWLCNNKQLSDSNQRLGKGSSLPKELDEEKDGEVFFDAVDSQPRLIITEPNGYHADSCLPAASLTEDSVKQAMETDPGYSGGSQVKMDSHKLSAQPLSIKQGAIGGLAQSTDLVQNHGSSQVSFSQTEDTEGTQETKDHHCMNVVSDVRLPSEVQSGMVRKGATANDLVVQDAENGPDETIAVEQEADLIRFHRCIEGEEEIFQPLWLRKLDEEQREEQNKDQKQDDEDEPWIQVVYNKKRNTPFVWQQTNKDDKNSSLDQTPKKRNKRQRRNKTNQIEVKVTDDEMSRVEKQLQKEQMMLLSEAANVRNIWSLSPKDRLRLYLYWLECYRGRLKMEIQREEQIYEQLCCDLDAAKRRKEERVLRRATVVGMTTSCASRYHSTLQRIRPKIVVIEEAAEVMEAHIITSLSLGTEHTILIGDHKQLRPKATVYELAQKYNLEISLFERMVMNDMECKCLNIQHRMRPEIAELTKRIYEHKIVDHDSVCHFENILGVGQNLFFINHCEPEKLMPGLQSYCNNHEADFVVKLCNYLLLQGYKSYQITILTMYTGQLLELQGKMPRRKYEGVKVCAVDNFQGEENDIILLSLVRSNKENRIGFLKDSNRICVALSRARQGFYCIGNFNLLSSECPLWRKICDDAKTKEAIGDTLDLVCQRHQNVNKVSCSADFERVPYGGCGQPCGYRLECGHACDKPCHLTDLDHTQSSCRKKCLQFCPNEHECELQCHYPRDCECQRPMTKTIPQCGHEQTVPCSIEAANFLCLAKCEKILDCGHNCRNVCGKRCKRICFEQCKKELPCGHKTAMACHTDPTSVKCKAKCNKVLECGHPCLRQCIETCCCTSSVQLELPCKHYITILCSAKDQPIQCPSQCNRRLGCGHSCPGICYQDCSSFQCNVPIQKNLPCGHQSNIHCHLNPARVFCSSPCKRQLDCGHQCPEVCGFPCKQSSCSEMITVTLKCDHQQVVRCGDYPNNVQCSAACDKSCQQGHPCSKQCHGDSACGLCPVMVNITLPKCNHIVKVPCHQDAEAVVCPMPCERLRSCQHPCNGICGEDCTARRCTISEPVTLRCGHTVDLPCHTATEEVICKKKVKIELACGHKKNVICSDFTRGESWIQMETCEIKVSKVLPCSHKMWLKCSEDESKVVCRAPCTRRLSCGHPCPGQCGELCKLQKCSRIVEKRFSCGHKAKLPCFDTKTAICKEHCVRRKDTCQHFCKGICGRPCSNYPCRELVIKTLQCGHRIQMSCCHHTDVQCPAPCGVPLPCGHACSGTCSTCQQRGSHEICQHPCGRLLVCSHRCEAMCCEPCPPCFKPCRRRCPHGRCRKRCSEPCQPCQLPCAWSCPHYQCNNLCREICERPPCNAPCSRRLFCGHPCIGLCGENCPTACGICHEKQLFVMLHDQRGSREVSAILQLFDCGHLKKVTDMDAWMLQDLGTDVQFWRCRECSSPITFSYRYGNQIKRTMENFEKVKLQTKELAVEAAFSTSKLTNNPFARAELVAYYTRGESKYLNPRDVLFLFALKNKHQILHKIQRTERVLNRTIRERKRRPVEHKDQRYQEMEDLSSITAGALDQMVKFLDQLHLDLELFRQLHEHTRKLSLLSYILEAENEVTRRKSTFSPAGETRLSLVTQQFSLFLQGNNDALPLPDFEKIVNSLRNEVGLDPLPTEEANDFENFPGFSKGVWKLCSQGHVYARRLIKSSARDIPIIKDECHRCEADFSSEDESF